MLLQNVVLTSAADVKCFGSDNCYPLAFGVPAALMLAAIGKFSTYMY